MKILLLLLLLPTGATSKFLCPKRCQCYEDVANRGASQSVHLICKWEQLNTTYLETLEDRDLVRTLTIRCPHLTAVTSRPSIDLFRGLRNLDRLEIDRCPLHSLPEGIFMGLGKLYSLIIKNAKLVDLPRTIFDPLLNLMTLELSNNALRIEPFALRSLNNLIHLDLSNNSIAFVANTLVSLSKLKVLILDSNQLTNIDFRRLPEGLTDVSLRNNYINTLHYVPNSARHLTRLDLSGNVLHFVSSRGANTLPTGLKTLDLSKNAISLIQESAFAHLKNLTHLDLRNNELTDLREESLSGPDTKLRVLLENNTLQCTCSLRWIIHPTQKLTPRVADMDQVRCSHITASNRDGPKDTVLLVHADRRNELLCKYTEMCEGNCTCCQASSCSCREVCPPGCLCFRSANMDRIRSAQNVITCETVTRVDLLVDIPLTTTELKLNGGSWRHWSVDSFRKLSRLQKLTFSNTTLTDNEAALLTKSIDVNILSLEHNELQTLPPLPADLQQLSLRDNPLDELTTKQLEAFADLRRVQFGGKRTKFFCDCEMPSPLQRWMRSEKNRNKLVNETDLLCELRGYGKVSVVSTLPGNGSLCETEDETVDQWVKFVQHVEQTKATVTKVETTTTSTSTQTTTTWQKTTTFFSNGDKMFDLETDPPKTTSMPMTTKATKPTVKFTTPHPRRRFPADDSHSPNKAVNSLIMILFVCIIVLIVAIAYTLFTRFFRPSSHLVYKQCDVDSEQR